MSRSCRAGDVAVPAVQAGRPEFGYPEPTQRRPHISYFKLSHLSQELRWMSAMKINARLVGNYVHFWHLLHAVPIYMDHWCVIWCCSPLRCTLKRKDSRKINGRKESTWEGLLGLRSFQLTIVGCHSRVQLVFVCWLVFLFVCVVLFSEITWNICTVEGYHPCHDLLVFKLDFGKPHCPSNLIVNLSK